VAVYTFTVDQQLLSQWVGKKIRQIGVSVALQGERVIAATEDGDVVILNRNLSETWELEGYFPGLSSSSGFSRKVALSGEWAIVGDPQKRTEGTEGWNYRQGSAYLLRRHESGSPKWSIALELAPEPGEIGGFGGHVDISKNYVLVGAHTASGNGMQMGPGAVHVYKRVGDNWILSQILRPPKSQNTNPALVTNQPSASRAIESRLFPLVLA
jgi:hypothetical protein